MAPHRTRRARPHPAALDRSKHEERVAHWTLSPERAVRRCAWHPAAVLLEVESDLHVVRVHCRWNLLVRVEQHCPVRATQEPAPVGLQVAARVAGELRRALAEQIERLPSDRPLPAALAEAERRPDLDEQQVACSARPVVGELRRRPDGNDELQR